MPKHNYRYRLPIQMFAEEPQEPQAGAAELELSPSPAETAAAAAETAAAAMATVKQIEVEALAMVVETLETLLGRAQELVDKLETAVQETEDYRQEALDIVEALKQPLSDETDSGGNDTTESKHPNEAPKSGGLMAGLKAIL